MNHIIEYLKQAGIKTVSDDYRTRILEWREWYAGYVESFHKYNVWNGISSVGQRRTSLDMAKTVCEDWANLLLNERVKIAVDGDQETVDELLSANRFTREGNRTIEKAFALGTGAFSEYLENDVPRIDYHDALNIWPLAWSGSEITECAFSSVDVLDGKKCIYLRIYRRNHDGTYYIVNRWLDEESGKPVACPDDVIERVETGLHTPLFQIITPNIANNIDTICPMGISIFANALDALRGIDTAYDSFVNEFVLGRKRLMIPASMAKIEMSKDGTVAPIFDPRDTTFIAYTPAEDQHDGFHDLSPEIRADAHLTGIRTSLNVLSFKCGLGTGRYDFDRASGVKTATEVISEHSDLYQSMVKHEQVLRDVLTGLVRALLALSGRDAGADITITFDDSVIQDRTSEITAAQAEVAAGLMSKFRYLTEIKGMAEDAAEEELARIMAEERQLNAVSEDNMQWFTANQTD